MRLSLRLRMSLLCSVAVLACGREPLDLGPTGSGGGTASAGATGSGGPTGAAGTSGAAGTTGSGGSAGAPSAPLRVPSVHRPTAASCPTLPASAPTMCPFGNPGVGRPADWCFSDADCASGKDGRCEPSINGPWCSCAFDACFADADCPGAALCLCSGVYSGNTCVSASCHVDADCGVGGYCSPVVEGCSSQVMDYACHTAKDTCSDNKDCPLGSSCAPDPSTGVWACGPGNGCPA